MGRQVAALPAKSPLFIPNWRTSLSAAAKSERITVVEAVHTWPRYHGYGVQCDQHAARSAGRVPALLRSIAKSRPFYSGPYCPWPKPGAGMWRHGTGTCGSGESGWRLVSQRQAALECPVCARGNRHSICYDQQHATVAALTGTAPLAFSVDELRKVFRGGVLMDVDAWRSLERLGLTEWTGVKSAKASIGTRASAGAHALERPICGLVA